jgi:8-oxo-dGTP pyrophosphatase MutT (NUDIX family)
MRRGSRRVRLERVVSAGGVVCRRGPQGIEVVLCGRDGDRVWALPKGAPEPGESLEWTALREVGEETGLRVVVQGALGSIRYRFARHDLGVRFDKTVHHFLMSAVGGQVEDHDSEYDRVRWFLVEEALRLLSYRNEADVVRRAVRRLEEGSGRTA